MQTSRTTKKTISRMDSAIAKDVVALSCPCGPREWIGKRCTRVVKARGGKFRYDMGTLRSYDAKSDTWELAHEDGFVEWLALYEVILGVQLYRVRVPKICQGRWVNGVPCYCKASPPNFLYCGRHVPK